MLFVRLVAHRTLEVRVARNGDGALDLRVACLAPFWNLGRLRVVGLMAGDARLHRVVGLGDYLGEAGGPRRLVLVAEQAVGACPRHVGFDFFRVLSMGGFRAVACLAGDPLVIAGLLLRRFRVMAIGTGFAAGKLDLPLRILHDGGRPVVTIEVEIGRDEEVTGYESTPQDDDARYEEVADLLRDSVPHPPHGVRRQVLHQK